MEEKEYMTLKEVAAFLHHSIPTIKNYLKEQRIPAYKIGKKWMFEKGEIIEWVEAQKASAGKV